MLCIQGEIEIYTYLAVVRNLCTYTAAAAAAAYNDVGTMWLTIYIYITNVCSMNA